MPVQETSICATLQQYFAAIILNRHKHRRSKYWTFFATHYRKYSANASDLLGKPLQPRRDLIDTEPFDGHEHRKIFYLPAGNRHLHSIDLQ